MRGLIAPLCCASLALALMWLLTACMTPVATPPSAVILVPAPAPAVAPLQTALPVSAAPRYRKLPPPEAVGSMDEVKVLAAMRMVAAHPDTSYEGKPPEPLLAIPVLEIELHADGSVRHITVLREPRQAKDTIQLAIDIVNRAAPYGDVSRLKKPWKFVEVFLFDDDRRFKLAVLDR